MKLFEKSSIGKMNLKNRIIMGPMGTSAEGDGGYSRRIIRYYEERAKGGTGMIITGMNQATDKYEDYYCNLLSTHHHVSRLGELADALHRYECKLCVQIGPGLGRMATLIPGKPVYSASATPLYWRPDVTCTPYSVDQIKDLVKSVSYAANLAKRAGADAVELHAYGGYLLDQFQCSLWNKRDDEYGGDLRGRMKIVLDIIANIRRICGPDFPLIVKFTPMHCIPGGR